MEWHLHETLRDEKLCSISEGTSDYIVGVSGVLTLIDTHTLQIIYS